MQPYTKHIAYTSPYPTMLVKPSYLGGSRVCACDPTGLHVQWNIQKLGQADTLSDKNIDFVVSTVLG